MKFPKPNVAACPAFATLCPGNTVPRLLVRSWGIAVATCACAVIAPLAEAQSPVTTCDAAGIGSVVLIADGPPGVEK